MSDLVRRRVLVAGRVQGVGFRFFVIEEAERLGLCGWVRNLPDGRVEAELEGSENEVSQLIEQMRVGPRMSRVNSVVVELRDIVTPYPDFQLR